MPEHLQLEVVSLETTAFPAAAISSVLVHRQCLAHLRERREPFICAPMATTAPPCRCLSTAPDCWCPAATFSPMAGILSVRPSPLRLAPPARAPSICAPMDQAAPPARRPSTAPG